jgi:cysteine desulfurase/selenocysteine lyase
VKEHFPIFRTHPNLIFLDSASTSQKPQAVIDREREFYEQENANIHRGLYALSAEATQRYEAVRKLVSDFIRASTANEIAFTKGTTESINIVANSFRKQLGKADNVVVTAMEHHANFIPWQQLCLETGAEFRVAPITQTGDLDLTALPLLLDDNTKILAVTHISNVLGTINPIDQIIRLAHQKNIPVLIDAAQSVGHVPIDVKNWDVDFLVFSAHKMFGPMGVGVLYAKSKHHHLIQPLNFGGGIVKSVSQAKTDFLEFPRNVEAGTPNVAGVVGLGAVIEFLKKLDWKILGDHSHKLAQQFRQQVELHQLARLVGNPKEISSTVSFVVDGMHPHDVAAFLAERNIAVRAGHHCAQPLHDALGVAATVRASFSIYNTSEDVTSIVEALRELASRKEDRNINQLYHDVIKQHDKSPYHFKKITEGVSMISANNPVCGDKFELYFKLDSDRIADIHFHGFGCAVSRASTSVLVKNLENQSIGDARKTISHFLMLIDKNQKVSDNVLDEFAAFNAVRQFPERYDCAALSWLEAQKFLNSLTQKP